MVTDGDDFDHDATATGRAGRLVRAGRARTHRARRAETTSRAAHADRDPHPESHPQPGPDRLHIDDRRRPGYVTVPRGRLRLRLTRFGPGSRTPNGPLTPRQQAEDEVGDTCDSYYHPETPLQHFNTSVGVGDRSCSATLKPDTLGFVGQAQIAACLGGDYLDVLYLYTPSLDKAPDMTEMNQTGVLIAAHILAALR